MQDSRALELLQSLPNRNMRLACERLGDRDVDHGLLGERTDEKALQELELAGILQRLNERKWGRVWECDQLLNLVDAFEKRVRIPRP